MGTRIGGRLRLAIALTATAAMIVASTGAGDFTDIQRGIQLFTLSF